MSETTIPVAEAARDFFRILELVEHNHQSAVLVRDGKPVATLNPIPSPALNCEELAARWGKLEKLPADEAKAFADDVEQSHNTLPSVKPVWD
jgi:antitoxin (DNA-binding transcriptional repressor) of toxin-antitoxin stability system